MAVAKLLNLLAVSSLAILACSYGATHVTALSLDPHHLARSPAHGHASIAKKKRSNNKRCKARPVSISTSVTVPSTTHAPTTAPSTTHAPTTTKSSTKAPVPTTTKASTPPPSSGGGSTGSGKVGLGWPQDDDTALAHFKTDNVKYIYNWSPYIDPKAGSLGFEGIPMLWGPKQESQFKQLVVEGYATKAFGFNEPNQQGQSDMDPGSAASLWKQYMEPLASKGYSLITPACTNAPSGKTWYNSFFSACGSSCHFDGMAVHYYGTSAQDLISYITDMHNTFGLDIWITEYACEDFSGGPQCSAADVSNFMSETKSFFESTSWVAGYFWFGAMYDMGNVNALNQLLNPQGYPTSLGQQYIN